MIVPDTNLLLYAHNAASPYNKKARAWWSQCLAGDEQIRVPIVVVFGFIRIATNARLFPNAMSSDEALTAVQSWFNSPSVSIVEDPYQERVFSLIKQIGDRGNLVTDAQIAAVALEENGVLHTADTDFHRFPELRVLNPLI
jgi:hypothetical protein